MFLFCLLDGIFVEYRILVWQLLDSMISGENAVII